MSRTNRDASDGGKTFVFSTGKRLVNVSDVPMLTYSSSEGVPDWMITIGTVDPQNHHQYSGPGAPAEAGGGVLRSTDFKPD